MARDWSFRPINRLHFGILRAVVFFLFAIMIVSLNRATALVGSRLTTCRISYFLSSSKHMSVPIRYDPLCSAFASMPPPRFLTSKIIMMASVDSDEQVDTNKTVESTWNIPGLKKEVMRLIMRCHKKIGKASTRLSNAQTLVDKLTADDNATLEQLEQCPDIDALEFELQELKTRLTGLNELESLLEGVKGKSVVLPLEAATLALQLGVNDAPPARPPRGPKKKKGPRQEASRLPYRRFYTLNKTEIRVGKQAEDNDELSLRPEHRDGSDWWMHASGCPGSHVVIKCSDQNLDKDVIMDAAALAARQSKCNGSVIKVSLTRCRDVKKPPGAKAGLVQLTGSVRTVSVNMKEAESRLDRLDKTVKVN